MRILAAPLLFIACGSGPSAAPVTPVSASPLETVPSSEPAAASSTAPSTVSSTAPSATPSALKPVVRHAPEDLDPGQATQRAPDVFSARFSTTKGDFVVEVRRNWAPHGADRFFNLVSMGFYDDTRFFRAISGFMVQFGIPGDPAVASKWQDAHITDDPVTQSNRRGFVAFAQTGMPNSRTTQVFIDYGDNSQLDASNFAPFGRVAQGMDVVDSLYMGYGEGAPNGSGPSQARVQSQGNAYLDEEFPRLDRILSARVVAPPSP